jgi:hypothetical protein
MLNNEHVCALFTLQPELGGFTKPILHRNHIFLRANHIRARYNKVVLCARAGSACWPHSVGPPTFPTTPPHQPTTAATSSPRTGRGNFCCIPSFWRNLRKNPEWPAATRNLLNFEVLQCFHFVLSQTYSKLQQVCKNVDSYVLCSVYSLFWT